MKFPSVQYFIPSGALHAAFMALCLAVFATSACADLAADYATQTAGVQGQTTNTGAGIPGGVAPFGAASRGEENWQKR